MIVRITQHLIFSGEALIEEFKDCGFGIPDDHVFNVIYDEDDAEDGGTLEFEISEEDKEKLVLAAKGIPVDYIQVDKIDEVGDAEEEIYCSY